MRVTTGLGDTGGDTPRSPAVGAAPHRSVFQGDPLPGPARWAGTAEGVRRSVAASRAGRSDLQWSDQDDVHWDEVDRKHALRYEAEQDETVRSGTHGARADRADRLGADRAAGDRYGSDRYRGSSRQWSDRDWSTSSTDRPGAFPTTMPRSRGGSAGPVSLRAPRVPAVPPLSPASLSPRSTDPVVPTRAARLAAGPLPALVPVGEDPTPLFTATEYVAAGESPLYQLVAEFIAIGDSLPDQDVTQPIVIDDSRVYREAAEPSEPAVQPVAVPVSPVRRSQLRAPQVLTPEVQASQVRAAEPYLRAQPSSVRPTSMQPSSVRSAELPSGRHRDGWRVAGHLSAAESGRRSAARAPRHRAA